MGLSAAWVRQKFLPQTFPASQFANGFILTTLVTQFIWLPDLDILNLSQPIRIPQCRYAY